MLYEALLEEMIGHLAPLQDTAAALAELDVLSNLAERALNLDLNCRALLKSRACASARVATRWSSKC